jgi:hypothetical protein
MRRSGRAALISAAYEDVDGARFRRLDYLGEVVFEIIDM